jgi:hypothetical protein
MKSINKSQIKTIHPGQYIYLPLLNNLSAGQPNSLCLQYLQVKVPRINPLPAVANAIIANKVIRRSKSNLIMSNTIPMITGISETNKSGIISFQDILLLQKFKGSPFLKNNELILPLPNPQVLPQ